jgi:hypothetical protein
VAEELTPRKKLLLRWSELKQERSSWVAHWQELSDHLLPRSGRFFSQDRNRGEKRYNKINDSTATKSLRILSAGMMSNMTSPARPWFRLSTSDPKLDESENVKQWLADVQQLMNMVFNKSNTYRSLHTLYEELGAFGTAGAIVLPDFQNVLHVHTLTAGEYAIGTDHQGKVDTIYREFDMTVGQVVKDFGLENCSTTVKQAWERGSQDKWVTVMHCIEPRLNRDTGKLDAKNMPFKSVYFELAGDSNTYLREGGFKRFPALCPRWSVSGGDIYGNSPGMEVLGDVKQLQHEQMRKAQGIDYQTKPPLQAPPNMKGREVDGLPGGISYVEQSTGGGIRSLFESRLDLGHLLEDIRDVRERIRGGFFADMFLMMASDTRSGITATEVAERHEEKMLMLGPVVERLHNEILSPLIDMAFDRMVEAGIIPPAPEEISGMELSVEFVSVLAQAQRAVATNSVDRFIGNLGAVAQYKPEVLDKLDADKWADEYADMLGVNPNILVPADKVAEIRMQRQQAQQAAQQAAAVEQIAGAAQKLGTVQTPSGNAANDVMQGLTGYTT